MVPLSFQMREQEKPQGLSTVLNLSLVASGQFIQLRIMNSACSSVPVLKKGPEIQAES